MMEFIEFSAISSSPIKFSQQQKDFFIKHILFIKKMKNLKMKLLNLKKKNFETRYLETENKQITRIVKLDKSTAFTTVGAKVMIDKNSPYLNSVL